VIIVARRRILINADEDPRENQRFDSVWLSPSQRLFAIETGERNNKSI